MKARKVILARKTQRLRYPGASGVKEFPCFGEYWFRSFVKLLKFAKTLTTSIFMAKLQNRTEYFEFTLLLLRGKRASSKEIGRTEAIKSFQGNQLLTNLKELLYTKQFLVSVTIVRIDTARFMQHPSVLYFIARKCDCGLCYFSH